MLWPSFLYAELWIPRVINAAKRVNLLSPAPLLVLVNNVSFSVCWVWPHDGGVSVDCTACTAQRHSADKRLGLVIGLLCPTDNANVSFRGSEVRQTHRHFKGGKQNLNRKRSFPSNIRQRSVEVSPFFSCRTPPYLALISSHPGTAAGNSVTSTAQHFTTLSQLKARFIPP